MRCLLCLSLFALFAVFGSCTKTPANKTAALNCADTHAGRYALHVQGLHTTLTGLADSVTVVSVDSNSISLPLGMIGTLTGNLNCATAIAATAATRSGYFEFNAGNGTIAANSIVVKYIAVDNRGISDLYTATFTR